MGNFDAQELTQACIARVLNFSAVAEASQGKVDPDTRIRKAFFELMGTERPTRKDYRDHQSKIFRIIEDVLTETYLRGVYEDPFFTQFAEIRNLAEEDKQEFFIPDDSIVTVSEHAGNHWRIRRQKIVGGDTITVETKPFAAAMYGDFHDFLMGRLTFGRLIDKVAEGIRNKVYGEVSAAFASAASQLPTELQESGNYDLDKLLMLYSHVEAAAGNAVVLGTRRGLSKVIEGSTGVFSDSMKNEYARAGMVGNFNGMNLAQLPAIHKANSFDFVYEDDVLLILPLNDAKFIKLVFEGDDMVKETTENTKNFDQTFDYSFLTRFGTKVVFSTLFARYKIL